MFRNEKRREKFYYLIFFNVFIISGFQRVSVLAEHYEKALEMGKKAWWKLENVFE